MPKCKQILLSLGVTLPALCCFSQARAQEEPAVELDAIVITAPRESGETAPPDAPSTTTRISRSQPLADSAADVAGSLAGVHVTEHGGLEAATSVSIRGSSRSQVSLHLDGIPLESASGGGISLTEIGALSLSTIEVYKSFAPSRFGTSAVGGVIDLRSRAISRGWRHRYDFGFGSFMTFFGAAEASHGGEKGDFLLRADYRRTAGDFTFLDDNGTPLNAADDRRVKRANNEYASLHPQIKWVYRFDERTRMETVTHFFQTIAGVPGLENFQSRTAGKSLTEWLGRIAFSRDACFGAKAKCRNEIYWRLIRSRFSDLNGEIGLGAGQDNDERTVILGDRLETAVTFSENWSLASGAEYAVEAYSPRDELAARPIGSSSTRQQLNVWAEPKLSLWRGKGKVSGQIRAVNAFYDINNDDPSLFAPGTYFSERAEHPLTGTIAASFAPVPAVTLKASAGRSVRLPKFSELFGDQGTVLGNPQLLSEKAVKWDGGIVWKGRLGNVFRNVTAEAAYFESQVNDLIQFELASGIARAGNVGKARVRGIEALVALKLPRGFSLSQNYTWQRATERSLNPGNFLVGRPEHEANSEASFARGPVKASVRMNLIDNQFLDALNTRKIETRLRLDAQVSCRIGKRVTLGLEGRNLSGTQIVDAVGFPLPGRSFFGRVSAAF